MPEVLCLGRKSRVVPRLVLKAPFYSLGPFVLQVKKMRLRRLRVGVERMGAGVSPGGEGESHLSPSLAMTECHT